MQDIIKMGLKEIGNGVDCILVARGKGQITDHCEHVFNLWDCVKCGEFVDWLC